MRRLMKALAVIVGVVVVEQILDTVLMVWAFKSRNPRLLASVIWLHKHVENPLMVRFFSGRSSHAALLHHVGRRSGKTYVTPLTADRSEDAIIILLPYGTETDWLRNLQSAGQGVVELEGRSFAVDEPEVVPIDQVMPLLTPALGRMAKYHEAKHALRLHVVESNERRTA